MSGSPAPPSDSASSMRHVDPALHLHARPASEALFIQQHPEATREISRSGSVRYHIDEEDDLPVVKQRDSHSSRPEIELESVRVEGPTSHIKSIQSMFKPIAPKTDIGMKESTSSSDLRVAKRELKPHSSFLMDEDNISTVLVWQNLTVTTPIRGTNERKVLLDGVSGSMTGGMWAIMGPSGCGKSTLLNALACRLDTNIQISGEMRLNGRPYASAELKRMSGYTMQDDLLNPNLTVRETLHYTAALRLPRSWNPEDRDRRVNEVIREMGLLKCQDVIVGDPSQKGISGGERRRLVIGMELLTRPSLLFLDEPTSGLDSVTALALVQLLQRITRSGKCSMMISIHQPQAKLFALFDRLLLLKSGRILFQGSIPAALQLFEDCGFPVPHYSNPADHLLDVITPPMDLTVYEAQMKDAALLAERNRRNGSRGSASLDLEIAAAIQEGRTPRTPDDADDVIGLNTPLGKALSLRRKQSFDKTLVLENSLKLQRPDQANEAMLIAKFQTPEIDLGFGLSKPLIVERDTVSWVRQLRILMQRNVKETWRKQSMIWTAIIQTIIMAVLIGTVFLRIGDDQSSTIRRQPVLFFVCINQGMFGSLTVINSFPAERALMIRERAAGTYFASAYFIAKTTVDTIMNIHLPIIFSVIVYWLIGLQADGAKFIIFTIFMCLCCIASTSLALMVSALCKTTDLSVTVLPLVLEAARLFGGFFLSPANAPDYFKWLDAVSYIRYSYIGVSLNELNGLDLHCTDSELNDNGGVCPYTRGEQFIDSLDLDYISMGGCIGVLIGYIFLCRVIAYIAIRYMKT